MTAIAMLEAGPRPPFARRVLQVLYVVVAGLYLVRFGILGMVLGGAWVAGGAEVTAQLDSETRFTAAVCFGVGLASLWLAKNFERAPLASVWLAGFSFLGGLMRLVSISMYGVPGFTALVATGLELLLPLVFFALLSMHASK